MENKNDCSIILVLRHGERSDYLSAFQGNEIKPSLDPELTERGINDARLGGKFIKETFIDKYNFDSVQIFSSPFIRSLQTAVEISKETGINEVNVSYGICEKLGFDLCGGKKPFDRMTGCNKENKESLESKYGCRINWEEDTKMDLVNFPEENEDAYKRFDKYINNLIENEQSTQHRNLIILASHGVAIDICRKIFKNDEEVLADYVCVSGIEVNKSNGKVGLFLNAYNKHIKRKEEYKIANGFLIV
jgi:broad specificity phosphatase PhoE